MITSRKEYIEYLKADSIARKRTRGIFSISFDKVWVFQRRMRRLEYLTNCRKNRLLRMVASCQYNRLGRLLGFSIPINVFGPGLSIAHHGTIAINSGTRVGYNCRLHVCVNIGTAAGRHDEAPKIGDNCYIAPGVKMFGNIEIGDNTVVGANAVVNKGFPEGNVTIGGIPAKVIAEKGSQGLITEGCRPRGAGDGPE